MMAARSSSQPGTPGGVVEREPPLPHQHADGGVQHGLRHRPRQQRRARLDRLGRAVEVRQRAAVALEQEPPALDDRHRVGGAVARPRRRTPRRPRPRARRAALAVGHASVGHGTPAGCGGSGSSGSVRQHDGTVGPDAPARL